MYTHTHAHTHTQTNRQLHTHCVHTGQYIWLSCAHIRQYIWFIVCTHTAVHMIHRVHTQESTYDYRAHTYGSTYDSSCAHIGHMIHMIPKTHAFTNKTEQLTSQSSWPLEFLRALWHLYCKRKEYRSSSICCPGYSFSTVTMSLELSANSHRNVHEDALKALRFRHTQAGHKPDTCGNATTKRTFLISLTDTIG